MSGMTENKPLKICVLGNSHVGSLKLGWNLLGQDYPEISLTFFAARKSGLEHLTVANGMLVPGNNHLKSWLKHVSGGATEIDLAAFDICLIHGLRLAFPYKTEINRIKSFFSKAAYECALHDHIASSLAFKTLKKIRELSDIPVYLGHIPLNALVENSYVNKKINYAGFIACANQFLAADHAILLAQPEATVTEGIYTKPELTSGAVRFDLTIDADSPTYDEADNVHMNDVFGRAFLESFFAQLPVRQS